MLSEVSWPTVIVTALILLFVLPFVTKLVSKAV